MINGSPKQIDSGQTFHRVYYLNFPSPYRRAMHHLPRHWNSGGHNNKLREHTMIFLFFLLKGGAHTWVCEEEITVSLCKNSCVPCPPLATCLTHINDHWTHKWLIYFGPLSHRVIKITDKILMRSVRRSINWWYFHADYQTEMPEAGEENITIKNTCSMMIKK